MDEDFPSDLFQCLSEEIVEKIFFFLNIRDTLSVEMVCRDWKRISGSDSLWKHNCGRLWRTKCLAPSPQPITCNFANLSLLPSVNYSPIIASLSVREIKSILHARKQNYHGLCEKEELVRLLETSTPPHVIQCSPLVQAKWKTNFVCSYLDSRRSEITKDELCSLKWMFAFNSSPNNIQHTSFFRPDFTYEVESEAMRGLPMRWFFCAANQIQVEQYPPLSITRNRKSWGWVLSNQYVTLYGNSYRQDS